MPDLKKNKTSKFTRFKQNARGVSTAAALLSIPALFMRRRGLSRALVSASAAAGLASILPSRRTINRLRGKKGTRKLSKAGKTRLKANLISGIGDVSLLRGGVLLPIAAFFGATKLNNKAKKQHLKSLRNRNRRSTTKSLGRR